MVRGGEGRGVGEADQTQRYKVGVGKRREQGIEV